MLLVLIAAPTTRLEAVAEVAADRFLPAATGASPLHLLQRSLQPSCSLVAAAAEVVGRQLLLLLVLLLQLQHPLRRC